ncbi:hypothetical protein [Amycolatopsis sp. MEPSY49]|uniref:hypothetical protein n=1 Tax=Amycolatopsis sp. MEPSY49 TaxID=3151600 RepID=UPI003EF3295E
MLSPSRIADRAAYCYVPRHKGYSNPITVFADIGRITGYLSRHIARQGPKPEPDQCDPDAWVYDIGENSDCSVDALISDNVADLIGLFAGQPTAKASFATKYVNRGLLALAPRGRTGPSTTSSRRGTRSTSTSAPSSSTRAGSTTGRSC